MLLLIILSTPPATRLVVRKLLPKVNAQLNGRLTVQHIGGSLLHRLTLRGVSLRDPEGEVVLQAERVDVGYSAWDFLHGKISLSRLLLERPLLRLLKDHPGEQYSILRVFTTTDTSADTTQSTINLTIRSVTLRDGAVIATVWRQPAAPEQEQAQRLDTVQLQNVNLSLPLLHYSAGPGLPRAALMEIGSARAYLANPELELDELNGNARMQGDSIVVALHTIRLPNSHLSADAWMVTDPNNRRFNANAHVQDLSAGDIKAFVSGADIPPDWHFRGDIRSTSLRSGTVLVQVRNLDLTLAGGRVTGQVTVTGNDNEWNANDSRLDVASVEVERLLRAFHIPSNLRATIDGFVTADGQSGTLELRLAGAAGYGVRGPVNGHIRASGGRDGATFETQLAVAGGRVGLDGEAQVLNGRAGGRHLALQNVRGELAQFDLAAIDARMPTSSLNGRFDADVLFGSMPREGFLRLALDSSMVRGVRIDSTLLLLHADNGLLTTDSLLVRAPGLQMTGKGTFGLTEDQSGDLSLTLDAPALDAVGRVVAALTNDSVAHLDGALHVDLTATGWLKQYTLGLDARGHNLAMNGFQVDSVVASASGVPDSLAFTARARVDSLTALNLSGRMARGPALSAAKAPDGRQVTLDSLNIERGDATWSLREGGRARMAGGQWTFDSATIARDPGPGELAITGKMPGKITVRAADVPITDLLGKGKRDSLPDLNATATYADGAAQGTVTLARSDRRPLVAEFVTKPLSAKLEVDSLDLGVFGPLAPSVKQLGGWLSGNLSVQGPADTPRLDGHLQLVDGTASVPATGVHYHDMAAALTFSGDALQVDQMRVLAGAGNAKVDGRVRFTRLDHPELQVAIKTERFPIMNRRDFLEATATGDMHVTGSPAGAVMTGNAHVNQGNAYLERFMRSSGIDLSDSLYAQFVDTTVLREATGGGGFVSALMDSLRIDSISVDLGDNFWLKSPDASIQLAGQLTVRTAPPGESRGEGAVETTKAEKYRLVGTVRAMRGFYQMTFAPGLTREFTIREGTIRYFGSPRTDAELDLNADHMVRAANGDEIKITAHIGGTLEQPTVGLTSDVTPPLSETELISYLVFGAPTAQAFLGKEEQNSQQSSVFQKSAQSLANVLSGKLESAAVSQLGLPLDYFRIKPGEVQSGLAGTELVLGMQVRILGYPSFLRASPRFCPREQLLSLDHIGIDLETRLNKQWGVATSVEPMETCESLMSGTAARPYQFGVDLFWEKR